MPRKYVPVKTMPKKKRLPLVADLCWRVGDKGDKPKMPPAEDIARLVQHYRERPFDMIRDGVLRIISKDGKLIRFEVNEEQDEVLSIIEREYYAQRPVRVIVLKGRQIGMSTLSMAVNYVLTITASHKSAHLVTHRQKTNLSLFRMFKNYFRYTPDPLKPNEKKCKINKEGIEFEDPEFGVEDSRIVIESAENREKMSVGWTFQYNIFSEKALWPEQELVAGALSPTIPDDWPSVIISESTGERINDLFHTEYKEAKAGNRPGWYGLFFPVQKHSKYRQELTVPLEEFLAAMSEEDRARMERFNVSPEFMNWYIHKRSEWCSVNREIVEVFRRKYPMCEEECFWGAGMSFYDADRIEESMRRVRDQKLVELDKLPESISPIGLAPVEKFARCETIKNALSRYVGAQFLDNRNDGKWIVWERPRRWHKYVVSVDIAEGKPKIESVRASSDYSVIDVVRYTYAPNEVPALVQVAQYRCQTTDPFELAREAKAVAVMYGDFETGSDAFVIPERNGPGGAFIGQGKSDGMRFYMKQIGMSKIGTAITEEIGFQTTGGESQGARISMLIQARETYVRNQYLISSLDTLREMSFFSRNSKGKFEGSNNEHDDSVIAMSLAVECVRYLTQFTVPVPLDPVRAKTEMTLERSRRLAPPPMIDIKAILRTPDGPDEDESNLEAVGVGYGF